MMELARRKRIVAVDVILVDFYSAPEMNQNHQKRAQSKPIRVAYKPFTFIRCWRSEHVPQWLWTHLARRRHVIADLNKLVTLEDCVAGSHVVLVLQRHVEVLFIGSTGFTLACVQQLKDSGNFFGIGTNDIPLRNRSNMKHFAVIRRC